MPFYTTTVQDAALEALWPTTGPSPLIAGLTFEFGLLTGDPRLSGTVDEMPADGTDAATHWGIFDTTGLVDFAPLDEPVEFTGYARLTVNNDGSFWEPATGGEKDGAEQTFPGLTPTIIPTVRFNTTLTA